MERTLVVIPTFNERENIARLLDVLVGEHSVDVLVVDDGSPDGTALAVEDCSKNAGGRVKLLKRLGKGGRGSAVLDGFQRGLQEGYEIFIEMDADFSHNPSELPLFFQALKNADIVIGSRYLPGSRIYEWGMKRTIFSKLANIYARAVLRIPISDYTNGYRAYTRKAIEALDFSDIDAKGYVVLSEVAYELHRKGFKITEVPTVFVNRRRGLSNLTSHEIKEAFLSVLRIRFKKWKKL